MHAESDGANAWLSKTVGGLRELWHQGSELVIAWIVTLTAAYNLMRLRTLLAKANVMHLRCVAWRKAE
jgi:hypothetical protein